jgi:hypothetical protein
MIPLDSSSPILEARCILFQPDSIVSEVDVLHRISVLGVSQKGNAQVGHSHQSRNHMGKK